MNFSIIIPNLNGSKLLTTCLESLVSSYKKAKGITIEVILVDNNSTDNSIQVFTDSLPDLESSIILNPKNYGFAKAVNQGINKAKYDLVIVCNNDIKFHPNWFLEVTNSINKHPNYACYFGLVLNNNGSKIESVGLKYYWQGKAKNIGNGLDYNQETITKLKIKQPKSIWGASASLIVYDKNIIKNLGAFDEDFFAYEEDVDLAFRLQRSKHQTLLIPSAISYHLGGATSSKMGNFRSRMDTKNWIFLILKNYSPKELFFYFPQIFIERLRNLSGLIKQTISIYRWKSIYFLPQSILSTYLQVIIKVPKIIRKRPFSFTNQL